MSDIETVLVAGTLSEIGTLLRQKQISIHELVRWYLARIEKDNHAGRRINAVRSVSARALDDAKRLDKELAQGRARGPLHGIPIIVKDNVMVADDFTMCAGSKALDGFKPPVTATLAMRLKAAGAIIIGKANLTEFADYVSDQMPSEFSGAGGVVRNPFGIAYGRGQGSSIGSAAAVAASFAPVAIGSETQNSIQAPASFTSVTGFKPGVGRVSRAGLVPLVPSQDAPGAIARCVEDAWLVYAAIAGPDIRDTASLQHFGPESGEMRPDTLASLRIGVPRTAIADGPEYSAFLTDFDDAITRLAKSGAQIVDPCEIPTAQRVRDLRSSVFPTEFKASLDAFLADYAPNGINSLEMLIAWNAQHPEHIPYGQSLLLAAQETTGLDDPDYVRDRRQDFILTRRDGIDAALEMHDIDLLAAPMDAAAKFTGKAGTPVISIPIGINDNGTPVGLSLFGASGREAMLKTAARLVEAAIGQRIRPYPD